MAKSKTVVARPEVRHRRRPADTEHMTRLLVVGGVLAVIVIAAGLIGFGWYQTKIKPLGKTVLQVGTMKYSLAALERRMELTNNQSSFYQGQNVLLLTPDTMEELEVEAKLLQGATELGVSVSDEEFATEVKSRGNVSEDAEPDVYAASFKSQVKESGLKESEFRAMIEADLLQTKLFDYFKFVAKPSEAEIKANYLSAETEEEAQEALTRIRAGEDFAAVGEDVAGEQRSGALEWTPRGASVLPEEVEDYLFDTAEANQLSDPIEVGGAFYVVQLTEKDPNRVLDDTGRQQVAQRDLRAWLDGLDITTTKNLSEEDESRALNDVF